MAHSPHARDRDDFGWKAANCLAFAGLLFFALYYLTAFRFDIIFTNPARQVDFTLWRIVPSYILEHARYPAVVTGDWEHAIFQYLPSAAVMMLPLSWPPQTIAFAIWLLIEASAFALVIWIGLRLSGAAQLRARWLIAIAAVLLSENSLGWDFRNHNTNIPYLALVMLGIQARKTWLGALMFAISINLKLYSALIPAALAWRREYALAAATCAVTVLIAVALPIFAFGPSAFFQVASDWFAQIDYSMAIQSGHTASLNRSVATWLGVDPGASIANVTLRALQAAWLVMVACYFLVAARARPAGAFHYNQARLADMCVALIAPLPLSIWFIPYHAVVMLPAYMLLLTIVVADEWPKRLRVISAGACLACLVVRFAVTDWNYRGAVFLVSFTILLGALGVIRWALMRAVKIGSR